MFNTFPSFDDTLASPPSLLDVSDVDPPHPANIVAAIDAHNNVLTIFFFMENPPPFKKCLAALICFKENQPPRFPV